MARKRKRGRSCPWSRTGCRQRSWTSCARPPPPRLKRSRWATGRRCAEAVLCFKARACVKKCTARSGVASAQSRLTWDLRNERPRQTHLDHKPRAIKRKSKCVKQGGAEGGGAGRGKQAPEKQAQAGGPESCAERPHSGMDTPHWSTSMVTSMVASMGFRTVAWAPSRLNSAARESSPVTMFTGMLAKERARSLWWSESLRSSWSTAGPSMTGMEPSTSITSGKGSSDSRSPSSLFMSRRPSSNSSHRMPLRCRSLAIRWRELPSSSQRNARRPASGRALVGVPEAPAAASPARSLPARCSRGLRGWRAARSPRAALPAPAAAADPPAPGVEAVSAVSWAAASRLWALAAAAALASAAAWAAAAPVTDDPLPPRPAAPTDLGSTGRAKWRGSAPVSTVGGSCLGGAGEAVVAPPRPSRPSSESLSSSSDAIMAPRLDAAALGCLEKAPLESWPAVPTRTVPPADVSVRGSLRREPPPLSRAPPMLGSCCAAALATGRTHTGILANTTTPSLDAWGLPKPSDASLAATGSESSRSAAGSKPRRAGWAAQLQRPTSPPMPSTTMARTTASARPVEPSCRPLSSFCSRANGWKSLPEASRRRDTPGPLSRASICRTASTGGGPSSDGRGSCRVTEGSTEGGWPGATDPAAMEAARLPLEPRPERVVRVVPAKDPAKSAAAVVRPLPRLLRPRRLPITEPSPEDPGPWRRPCPARWSSRAQRPSRTDRSASSGCSAGPPMRRQRSASGMTVQRSSTLPCLSSDTRLRP
mmetsp:Transcript_24280/g.91652  ORF Transcript_24280/g.91652 Transcript_24280/m.91652 type:complete len:764 (+) Transcript_24280:3377-5668(+)